MKNLLLLLFISGFIFGQSNYKAEKLWSTDQLLSVSESVLYDDKSEIIYVSCINGAPTQKNGEGYIAKLSLDGKIIEQGWITGVNAPKGMAISGDKFYFTDIDRIVEADLKTGKLLTFYSIEGASFLNDIVADQNGNLYISGSKSSKIYKFQNGKASVFMDEKIQNPNGLYIEGDKLYIGNSGKKSVYVVNIPDKKILHKFRMESGIDGLKKVSDNEFLISDWHGWTYIINTDGNYVSLMDTTPDNINSADLEYIKSKNIILIPTFFDSRLVAYKLIKEK